MESNDLDAPSTDMDKDGHQHFVVPDFTRRDIPPSLSLQLAPSSHSPPITTASGISLPPDSAADSSFGRSSTQSPDGSHFSGSSILTPAPPFAEPGATATAVDNSPRSPEGSDLSPITATPSSALPFAPFPSSSTTRVGPSAAGDTESMVSRQPSSGPHRNTRSLAAASATSPRSESHSPPESSLGNSKETTNTTRSKDKDKEKRKRSRVTPEQLASLEHFFAMDRSPTAARRKEISELLGMVERQTQIWFQNRRAKAKLQDGKRGRPDSIFGAGGIGSMGIGMGGGDWADLLPSADAPPPQLSPDHEAELRRLIHEEGPVSFIPCTDLTIGTWRRIASATSFVSSSGVYSGVGSQFGIGSSNTRHDLIAYTVNSNTIPGQRCLTWFIHSAGLGFKMQIPLDTIIGTDFRLVGGGVGIGEQGLVTFILSRPPEFYLEDQVLVASVSGNPMQQHTSSPVQRKVWKKCLDWTEGMQATKVLRHDLIGSAVHIAYFLQELRDGRSFGDEGPGIKLVTPHQHQHQQQTNFGTATNATGPQSVSPPSVQLPQLPQLPHAPVGFGTQPPAQSQVSPYSSSGMPTPSRRPDYMTHGRKRSYSTPPTLSTADIVAAQQGLSSTNPTGAGGYHIQHPLSATFPSMQTSPLSSSPSPYPPPPTSAGSSTPVTGTRISQMGNLHSPMYTSYSGAPSASPPLSGPTPPTIMHHPQHRYQSPTQPIYQLPGNASDPHSTSPRDRALDVNPLMGSTVLNPNLLPSSSSLSPPQPAGMASTGPGPTSTAQLQPSYDSLRWSFPESIQSSSQQTAPQPYMHSLNNHLTTLTPSSSQHLYNPTQQQQPTSESGHSASSLSNPSTQHFHAEQQHQQQHRPHSLHNTSRTIYPIDPASTTAPVVSGMPGLPSTPFDNIHHPLQQPDVGQEGAPNTTAPPSFEQQ